MGLASVKAGEMQGGNILGISQVAQSCKFPEQGAEDNDNAEQGMRHSLNGCLRTMIQQRMNYS